MWSDSEAFRTIIIDIDPPLILHGVPMALDTALFSTSAGEALRRMRAHTERARASQERRLAYESPQTVEQQRRVKREKRAMDHARRQTETRRRNTERLELLATLARLSPVERLSRFSTDLTLKLDCVSAELIPTQERELIDMEKATAIALLTRIGRRKGEWGRMRRMIEHLFRDEPELPMTQADEKS